MSGRRDASPNPELARRRLYDLRETLVILLCATVAVTAWGLLVPTRFEFVNVFDTVDRLTRFDWVPFVGLMTVLIGSMAVGGLASVAVVERRRPWPFGPRVPAPRYRDWPRLAALVLAQIVGWNAPLKLGTAGGLYGTNDPAIDLRVDAPVDMARIVVVFLATYALADVLFGAGRNWIESRRIAASVVEAR